MKNINTFLKDKLKEKNMRIDTFISKSNFSKSTIYRVMKGYQKPSEVLLEKIISVLNLSILEQQELRYYSSLQDVDEDMLSARNAIYHLLYQKDNSKPDMIELVYYDNEKYIRTFNKILDSLVSDADKNNFTCKFRLVNSCIDSIVQPLYAAVSLLMQKEKDYSIEHLISFSNINQQENIMILDAIIPLLSLDRYFVKYREAEGTSGSSIFYDFLMIDYQFDEEAGNTVYRHLYFSFIEEGLSACYAADYENLREFFERSYDSLLHDFTYALNNQKKYELLVMYMMGLETECDVCLFKPNPCYNRIPLTVYESLRDRTSKESMLYFMSSFLCETVTEATVNQKFDELLLLLGKRIHSSFKHTQIDVYTRSGLEAFAATGMLSDHLEGIPPFIKSETRAVFEYIKCRDLDSNDNYRIFITKEDCFDNDLVLIIYRDHSMILEYRNPKYTPADIPYCTIEHKGLSKIFFDFAKNYVPNMIAMTQSETHAFLDHLLEKYCS